MVSFVVGEKVVYPSHGIGEIKDIISEMIDGQEVKLYVISFPQYKMVLKVPIEQDINSEHSLRRIVDKSILPTVYATLQKPAQPGNKMWSRRAQDYEQKIHSGSLVCIAEVLRDLYRNGNDLSTRSFSERAIYELALNRLANEVSLLESISITEATDKLLEILTDKILI